MPRRLLRDGHVVADEWRYVAETAPGDASPLIVTLDQWQLEPDTWISRGTPLGLVLSPAHHVEQVAGELDRFALIAAQFSGPAEGRGYTQARQLRDRWKFGGELRATGYVRSDQVFFMARCGFNSFELPESDLQDAHTALSTFTAAYQPSNDAGLPRKAPLKARHAAE